MGRAAASQAGAAQASSARRQLGRQPKECRGAGGLQGGAARKGSPRTVEVLPVAVGVPLLMLLPNAQAAPAAVRAWGLHKTPRSRQLQRQGYFPVHLITSKQPLQPSHRGGQRHLPGGLRVSGAPQPAQASAVPPQRVVHLPDQDVRLAAGWPFQGPF